MPRRRHTNSRKAAKARMVHGHAQFVRGFACLAEGPDCGGKIEAHHDREGTDGGTSLKPHDRHLIPLCTDHHTAGPYAIHRIRNAAFEARYGVDIKRAAADIARRSPHIRRLAELEDVEG